MKRQAFVFEAKVIEAENLNFSIEDCRPSETSPSQFIDQADRLIARQMGEQTAQACTDAGYNICLPGTRLRPMVSDSGKEICICC